MAITKRCIRCRKKVRADGTCQNPNCVLYVPEPTEETPSEGNNTIATETPSIDDSTQSDGK